MERQTIRLALEREPLPKRGKLSAAAQKQKPSKMLLLNILQRDITAGHWFKSGPTHSLIWSSGENCNYSPPHRDAFLLLDQQLTPLSSRCRVESKCRRDVSRAASCDATLVVSSGTLLV